MATFLWSCAPSGDSSTVDLGSSTTASSSEEADATTSQEPSWPEAWRGDFWSAAGAQPGQDYEGNVLAAFGGLSITAERVTFLTTSCADESTETAYLYQVGPEGLELAPLDVGAPLRWIDGIEVPSITVRPGTGCDEVLVDTARLDATASFLRGRLCLVDPCDEPEGTTPVWRVELCEGEPQSCAL